MVNLPTPLTTLVGRERDLAAVVDRLAGGRLVTVTGAGGVGKTRLAVAVASEVAARYRDGACLVDVDGVDEVSELWAKVATASRLELKKCGERADDVIAHLQRRQLLLVLDNCEHLTAACADVALSIAGACPEMSLLVTSRQPLGVEGEQLWPLVGLAVEPSDQCGRSAPAAAPAVRLFAERARARRPEFSLDARESAVVADVCRRLDGLPLAIELAAARVGMLSPDEILGRLDEPLSLLVGGSPAHPPRHRSVAATLDWSHCLLSEPEAVLFRRLAAFAGDFSLVAAEDVCGSVPLLHSSILDLLAALIAKSLVVTVSAPGDTRYRVPKITQAYAAERLAAAGEVALMRERHARWFLALAKEAERNLRGPALAPWTARVAADHDNFEAALEWTLDAQRSDWALEMATAMATFWRQRCLFDTGREWLTGALALPEQTPGRRAEALLALGHLVGESGDRLGAIGPLEEALCLARDKGDAATEARVLNLVGYFRLFCDVPTTALRPLERSREMARDAGDRRTLLESLSSAGWVARFGGNARVAEARFGECLTVARGADHGEGETWAAVVGMGWAAMTQGRFAEADARLADALATAARADSRQSQAVVWCHQGQLARARGDYAGATALLQSSLSFAREAGNPFPIAMRLALLGLVRHDQGDLDQAEPALLEAVAVPGAARLPFAHAYRLLALARLRVTQRQAEKAATLLAEAGTVARAHELQGLMAAILVEQARLRRAGDDLEAAARALTRAISILDRLGDRPATVDALEALGGVRASQGRGRTACRLLASASTTRADGGMVRPPVRAAGYQADVALARSGLSADEWDAVWARGAALSLSAAAAVAVRCHGRRDSVRTGWDAITPTEREVVALVAEGLTNREAAARLVVSTRTVETHVAHVLSKLGLPSRRELARVASAKGFGASDD